MELNKRQLNFLGTFFGAVAGIAAVLVTNGVVNAKLGGAIGGTATVLLGLVVQQPASSAPTTEDLEEKK